MKRQLIYLSTPYSRYIHGQNQAWVEACAAAAELISRGHTVYSPIAHTHPIAVHGGLDALDHARWLALDEAMMERCDEIWIVQMPGWEDSKGIAIERAAFEIAGKPERMLTWPWLEVV